MTGSRLRVSVALDLGLLLFIWVGALLCLESSGRVSAVYADPGVLYVAPDGDDSLDCSTPDNRCRTVGRAVDVASGGDEIRVATGVYTLSQNIGVTKTVTIRGGYAASDWGISYPVTQPTTLDAQGQDRVFYITGNISPTIEGLHITGGRAVLYYGGGVYVESASATLRNNWVFSNRAPEGGGLGFYASSAILIDNHIFSNTATFGGGVGVASSVAVLDGNIITDNIANQGGGGVYLHYSTPILSNNYIAGNSTQVLDGGGVSCFYSSGALNGNTVISNTGMWGGGGIYLHRCDIALNDNVIVLNTAHHGGGLNVFESPATFSSNKIMSNTALAYGGLSMDMCDNVLSGNTISFNTAALDGGGLAMWATPGVACALSDTVTLVNNIVADNRVVTGVSGISIGYGSAHLLHNTIARNRGSNGIGVQVNNSRVWLTSTILVSHTLGISVTGANVASLEATLWGSGAWANEHDWGGAGSVFTGTINVRGNPAFVDPDAGNYHIGSSSTAIGQGVPTSVIVDIDNEPRLGLPDLGADEYWAPNTLRRIYLPLVIK